MLPDPDCSARKSRPADRPRSAQARDAARISAPVRRATLVLSITASLLLPAGASFAQTDQEKAAARALATQGSEELKQNHYAQALDLVSRAEQIVHAPTHLLMIARAQVGMGKLVAAQETFLKLTREELAPTAPAAFKNAQVTARDELAAIEPKIGALRIVLDGPGQKNVTVKLDDRPVPAALLGVHQPVDPGPHVIIAYPVGQSPVKGAIEIHEAEKAELKLTIPNAPAGPGIPVNAADNPDASKPPQTPDTSRDTGSPGFFSGMRIAGIAAGVVGVGLIGGGAALVAKSGSTASQANAAAIAAGCNMSDPTMCPPSAKQTIATTVTPLDQSAASQKSAGVGLLAVGGAALVTGVVLIVIGKPKPAAAAAPPPHASVEPWFGGSAGGLRGTF